MTAAVSRWSLSDAADFVRGWVDDLFDSLPEDVDLDAEAQYAEDPCDGGEAQQAEPQERFSPAFIAAVRDDLSGVPERECLEAMLDVLSVLGDWEDMYLDHEKAVGHLLLTHGARAADLSSVSHEETLDRHATLHDQEGARHRDPA